MKCIEFLKVNFLLHLAPDPVSIKGNLTAMNGSKLSLTCEYNDTLPVGNSSLFYVGKNLFKEVLKVRKLNVFYEMFLLFYIDYAGILL